MSDAASSTPLPARRGARLYLAGNVMGQACALLRYTLLARLLGPEQLGLVAILTLVSNFFEMISDTGSDRFLVQDREGEDPAVQRMVHLVTLMRGVFMALGLLIFAIPAAAFFREPQLVAGLMVLGLSPLIAGLMHLDVRRLQRRNDFRAEGVAMLVSELAALAATVIAAFVVRDFTAVLYGLITRSVVLVVVSHFTAERRYALGYAGNVAGRLSAFALPLIANGVLLFVSSQSDRLMISRLVGTSALGVYSAVLLLVLYPIMAINRYFMGIHLPVVAAEPPHAARGSPSDLMAGRALILSLAIAAGFALLGPLAVRVLYGARFEQAPLLVALIGVLQTGRFIRVWPTTHALAIGRSRIVMANNLARLSGIPAAIATLVLIGGVPGIVTGLIVGELAALLTGNIMLNRARGVGWTYDMDRVAMLTVGCALIVGLAAAAQDRWPGGLALIPVTIAYVLWVARRERACLIDGIGILRSALGRGR